jgi:serine/threonine protein kinase
MSKRNYEKIIEKDIKDEYLNQVVAPGPEYLEDDPKKSDDKSVYILINDTYVLGKKLGKGSFGEVYMGKHKWSGKQVAIKLEPIESRTRILEHEYKVYQDIYKPNHGVTQCHYYGLVDDYSVLVIDLLGDSLGALLEKASGQFKLKTTLMIADQMISRLEYLHDHGFIHRDLKPDNMMIGRGHHHNQVFLIDYGLSKKYRSGEGEHIPFKEGGKLVGTARYASVNSHLGFSLSRRDDLISLAYILVYFLKGKLPWQKVNGDSKEEKYDNIRKLKQNLGSNAICQGLSKEFQQFLDYCVRLRFEQRPDYNYLKTLIRQVFRSHNFIYDLNFDWS